MLERDEYIEQAYFFRTLRERLDQNAPTQEVMSQVREELLSTTRLPMAVDFLRGEIILRGRMSEGMARIKHYFTSFQTFVIAKAEDDESKFDQRTALIILEREAEYRAGTPTPQGMFIYQFECLSRNKMGYDKGLAAISEDPIYSPDWSKWIQFVRLQLGAIEFTEMIFFRSQQYVIEQRRRTGEPNWLPEEPVLFGEKEGRISRANHGKDPLFLFAAYQRQLGYPVVPRSAKQIIDGQLSPAALDARLTNLEKKLALIDAELRGDLDLKDYYSKPNWTDEPPAESP